MLECRHEEFLFLGNILIIGFSQCIKRMVHVFRGRSLSGGVFKRFIVNLHIRVVITRSKSITCSQRQLKGRYIEGVCKHVLLLLVLSQRLFCILVNFKSIPDEVALEVNSEVSTMEACILH